MAIQVTGKNLDLGEALRAYVSDKVEKAIGKYFGLNLSGHVRIEKGRGEFVTNCSIHLPSGLDLQSSSGSQDAYASVDGAIDRLEKRLRRYKRRLRNHHSDGGAQDVSRRPSFAADYYVIQHGEDEAQEDGETAPVIVAETQKTIHQLSVSDAVMRMDLSDQPFLIFRNASHGRLNVVYHRGDGNIGWVDPGEAKASGAKTSKV